LEKAEVEEGRMTNVRRRAILRTPVDGKTTNDGYRCELCGAWIEYRDLGKVLIPSGWVSCLAERQNGFVQSFGVAAIFC
jgi:hypothetical protein